MHIMEKTFGEVSDTSLQAIKLYYGRMLANNEFYNAFYRCFFNSSPEVRRLFEGVDMVNQHKLLRHGINLMIMAAGGNVAGRYGLDRIHDTHSPQGMNITEDLYILWKHCFLTTLKSYDPEISAEIYSAWELLLDHGIAYIKYH